MSRTFAIVSDARSKLETLAWFVARPAMYRELGRRIRAGRFITARSQLIERQERAEATAWCVATAVPCSQALEALGLPSNVRSVAADFPEIWAEAERVFRTSGTDMGGAAYVDLLHHLTRELRPERVIETGVAAGWSSLAVLLALDANAAGELTSIDMPYPKRGNETAVGCVVPERLRSRWSLVRLPDRDGLPPAVARGAIGLAHYDSDKTYEGRMFAYPLLWRALCPGGVLISDDINDNLGFRDFAKQVGVKPQVVERPTGGFSGLIRRA